MSDIGPRPSLRLNISTVAAFAATTLTPGLSFMMGEDFAITRRQEGHGDVKVGLPCVVFGHDSDDGVRLVVDFKNTTKDIAVSVVVARPEVVGEEHLPCYQGSEIRYRFRWIVVFTQA
jgi:hypothetical protein